MKFTRNCSGSISELKEAICPEEIAERSIVIEGDINQTLELLAETE